MDYADRGKMLCNIFGMLICCSTIEQTRLLPSGVKVGIRYYSFRILIVFPIIVYAPDAIRNNNSGLNK